MRGAFNVKLKEDTALQLSAPAPSRMAPPGQQSVPHWQFPCDMDITVVLTLQGGYGGSTALSSSQEEELHPCSEHAKF